MNEGHELEKEICEQCRGKVSELRKPWITKKKAALKSLMILNQCPTCKEKLMEKAWSMRQ